MSEFSRETLLNIIETDHVQCGEASALARMALAAMDGEPVAWLLSGGGTKNVVCFDSGNAYADPLREVTPLYRHAQQPAVPDKMTAIVKDEAEYVEGWNACRAAMLNPDKARKKIRVIVLGASIGAGFDATASGNSPAQSHEWIPVSERMPEDEQEVLTINRMGHRFVSFFDKHSGLYFDRLDAPAACCIEHVLVTHWMPLPAGPQEVR
ncbi:TPA: DUF551 domain-containing protein [Klebsiella pneumoniae]|nr:phage protein [Klebsiella pneumoniae]HBR4159243.1 DUF551 domain-containing protein [Klebsiella pneumoniae]HCI7918469.1 DUF551 domain-containing protein [Klebsiella pneumoniae]